MNLKLVGLLRDVLLENLRLGRLRVSEIHHLIQQFIDDDKIVSDAFFLQFFEIFGENLHDAVEEKQYLGGIGVPFCERKDVKIVVSDVEVLDAEGRASAAAGITDGRRGR